ncbi:hypothetical protein EDD90_2765 [Streptomyces sp. Ag109_O5-1]|uniref:hypothetical protein n=1 Tax=Streptomyces sp. Ag109_O5-1 TaxID=1938851 RepID=UPI000F510881|nr:hypothetical protein [Streptomyces sp. Ag109_O5-1]RPE39748.1 hypothetical protein EDD90_2765 [Streptomyces sp. Ag109_O5-1]
MTTPYITPAMLTSRPAGISWAVVPTLNADTAAQQAQLEQVCWVATSVLDTYCRQPLRATVKTDTRPGPGMPRVAMDRATGAGILVTEHRHVTDTVALALAPARTYPAAWSVIPLGQYRPRHPVFPGAGLSTGPVGGHTVDVAPGHIDARWGRGGWLVQLSYISGWPHTSLTAAAKAGDTQISVDDVTGWAQGWSGMAYDGPATEQVTAPTATATTPLVLPNGAGTVHSGPGTVTLAAPLTQPHPAGTVVSALPADVVHAAVLAATVQALETIDAIATQSLSGELAGGTGALATEVEMILDDYRRVM